ncbi:MAG TPA: hypothetical protein VMX17_09615 [Candidatus Glassbacteria bacterium]|nr:hypothetical protein [Candidatus Glassbacteria bacterium]
MKDLILLYKWMDGRTFTYNQEAKDRFKERGLATMRKLAKHLKLKEFKASFNPGGIAVPGDLGLMGMFNDEVGIYIKISQGRGPECMFRTIKNMKDYSGGSNNWAQTEVDFKRLPSLIHRLCGVNPVDLVGVKPKNLEGVATSIKQKTGKFKQEEYDSIYSAYQKHFSNGNYFGVGGGSHDRIDDLTLATLAYNKHVKTKKEGEEFLNQKFTFTGGKGTISSLLNCYRDLIWEIFNQYSNRYEIEDLWMYEEHEEEEEA